MDDQHGRHGMAGKLARKLAAARELPPSDLMLAGLCWVMLGTASLLIACLPSRRLLRPLGPNIGAVTRAPAITPHQRARAQRIARAIATAARHAPFRADCYPQALAAAQLCRWFGIPHAVQLGARFAAAGSDRAGSLEAHAWVCSEALTVCGGPDSARRFGTVACFVHDPRPARNDVAR